MAETKKKGRADKGKPRPQARDMILLRWIVEQGEVSYHQLQILLARYGEDTHKPTLHLSRVQQTVDRWITLGWVGYHCVPPNPYKTGITTRKGIPSIFATKEGAKKCGLSVPVGPSSFMDRDHDFDVNYVRLDLELWLQENYPGDWEWVSGRMIKSKYPNEPKWPDFEMVYKTAHVAGEVERTKKSFERYKEIKAYYEGANWERAKKFTRKIHYHLSGYDDFFQAQFGDLFLHRQLDSLIAKYEPMAEKGHDKLDLPR